MKYLFAVTLSLVILSACQEHDKSKLTLLNQIIPKDKAMIFGPGVVSSDNYEFAITFSPEMDEVFWTTRKQDGDNVIYTIRFFEGNWTKPRPAPFKAIEGWDFEPHIDPTGSRLYFGSTRPLRDSATATELNQWYCDKNSNRWSEPKPLEEPFADRPVTMYLTSSEKGNLYFTSGEEGDKPEDWVIYRGIKNKSTYRIERMSSAVNFEGKYIAHPYIAPDESFLIYDAQSTLGYGESDLYISFNINGEWIEAQNLGPKVNTTKKEMCPSLSPDGKYLFFHRGNEEEGNIYWIEFGPLKKRLEESISNL